MKILALAFWAAVISCDGASYYWQIVGGRDAEVGQFPYQVSVRIGGRHNCGGSILNEVTILTAAYCVKGLHPEDVQVAVGNLLSKPVDVYPVAKLVPHEDYSPSLFRNDVGIIVLSEKMKFNDLVQPIHLPDREIGGGVPVTLTGWGTTDTRGNLPDKLQFLNLGTYYRKRCEGKMEGIREEHLCTFTKFGDGACHGDSGDPLVSEGHVVGIVSFGRPCDGYPDVFTRVEYFREWILEQMNKEKAL